LVGVCADRRNSTNALKQLKALAVDPAKAAAVAVAAGASGPNKKPGKSGMPDCCICASAPSSSIAVTSDAYTHPTGLFSVTIQQSLFIAPCSHAFHYKCIRPLLDSHYPSFSCPLCRTYADLEADVELDQDDGYDDGEDGELDLDASGEDVVGAGALSRVATRDRDRDREDNAYPETDIEPDTGATRLGAGVRHVSADGDADLEMADALPVLSEDDEPLGGGAGLDGYAHLYARGGEADEGVEAHLMAIEGEGRRSASPGRGLGGSGSGVAVVSEGESSNGGGMVDADGTVGGKRKR
jgi:E3 ubiquitin-protein ligase DMA1/2